MMEGRNKLDKKNFILQGDGKSEQLMLWIKNYQNKIQKNILLSPTKNLAFFKQIIDKEAQNIVCRIRLQWFDA